MADSKGSEGDKGWSCGSLGIRLIDSSQDLREVVLEAKEEDGIHGNGPQGGSQQYYSAFWFEFMLVYGVGAWFWSSSESIDERSITHTHTHFCKQSDRDSLRSLISELSESAAAAAALSSSSF